VLLLLFPPISSHYQMSRQKQKGRGFGGEVRGPLFWHSGKNNMCPLSVTWTWSPSRELHLHRVLTCFICFWMLPSWEFGHFLATVSLYNPWTRGFVWAHPRSYEFTMDTWTGTPHLLHSQTMSQTHRHMHIYDHILPPCSLNLGDMISPLTGLLRCVWRWSVFPSAS
jgi:hypothetical protein